MSPQVLEEELTRLENEQQHPGPAASVQSGWYLNQLKTQVSEEQFAQLTKESGSVDEFLLKLKQAKAERALKESSH